MAALVLDGITIPLRSFDLGLSLDVASTTALVGPSGAGKSTVLRAVAGLVRPTGGRISCGDSVWFDAAAGVNEPPDRRRVGLVFQDYALFPHMTVRENVEYSRGRPADEYLERFQIARLEHARPGELSGGERQRVALARALARDPEVLLLDEPLSALDAHTRAGVRAELQELLRDLGLPVVLVSHDFDDAAALADRVGVIIDGQIRQTGTPSELVARPADPFVASFTGANLLHGHAERDGALTRVRLEDGTIITTVEDGTGAVVVAVYPWDIIVSAHRPDDSAMNVVSGSVQSLVELGNRVRVTIGSISADVTADSVSRLNLRIGNLAFASFKATGTRLV
ncbi:MAG TPA: ABC transporter ATP-binding protein [Gaiellaceae bacterium]|nr:ABC transporter ATP-binding protein [Gaiellaceae bacterium]